MDFNPAHQYSGMRDRPLLFLKERDKIFFATDLYVPSYNVYVPLSNQVTLCYLKDYDFTTGKMRVAVDSHTQITRQMFGIYLTWNNAFLKSLSITEIVRYNGNYPG